MAITRSRHNTLADLPWTLSLFGAAVGAGILFLPVRAGLSGFWITLALSTLLFPIIYCSHRLFASTVFHAPSTGDYTGAVGELVNPRVGAVTSVLFAGLLLMLLITYATALNNSLGEFLVTQRIAQSDLSKTPWFSLGILALFFSILRFGAARVVRVLGVLSGLLIALLIAVSLLLVELWHVEAVVTGPASTGGIDEALLLFPILTESFIFFPALSSMIIVFRTRNGQTDENWRRSLRIIRNATLLLICFTMAFVFSCLFALPADTLGNAAASNLSALDILGTSGSPLLAVLGPLVSILALTTSFFGIFLGYRESAIRLLNLDARRRGETWFLLGTFLALWLFTLLDISVIAILGEVGGPLSALFLFLIPAWAHIRHPGHFGERRWLLAFVLSAGIIQLCSYYLGSL